MYSTLQYISFIIVFIVNAQRKIKKCVILFVIYSFLMKRTFFMFSENVNSKKEKKFVIYHMKFSNLFSKDHKRRSARLTFSVKIYHGDHAKKYRIIKN